MATINLCPFTSAVSSAFRSSQSLSTDLSSVMNKVGEAAKSAWSTLVQGLKACKDFVISGFKSVLNTASAHPYATAGIVIGALGVGYMVYRRVNTPSPASTTPIANTTTTAGSTASTPATGAAAQASSASTEV